MRNLKRTIAVFVVLAVAGAAFLFILENQQLVQPSFMGARLPESYLSVYIVAAVALGVFLGGALRGGILRARRK